MQSSSNEWNTPVSDSVEYKETRLYTPALIPELT